MKRTLAILLACVLLAALTPAIAEETLTTIRVVTNDNSNNFGGNTYYLSDIVNGKLKSNRYDLLVKKLAERGLQIEWDLVTDDQYDTYLRTSLASGMDADIYCIEPLDDATRVSMAQDGYFLPLSALYPYSDGTIREYHENGDGKNRVAYQGLDGELYWSNIGGGSSVRDENGDIVSASYVVGLIRLDWAEKLNRPVPATPDELFDFVLACRENDVNGDGEKNEMIFMAAAPSPTAAWYGIGDTWYYVDPEEEEFTAPWYHEGWKDYLKFVKRLYDAGVLEMTSAQATLENENKLIGKTHWVSRNVTFTVDPSLPTPVYTPYMVAPYADKKPYALINGGVGFNSRALAINAKTDKVEAIAKLLDFTFTEDYMLLGEGYHPELEGITWVTDPETGLAVKPPVIEGNYDNDAAQHNRNYGLWNESLPMGTVKQTIKNVESGITDWNPVNQAYLKEVLWNYSNFICRDPLNRLCAIGTPEESELVAEYKTDLETYMNELATKLVMGERSFEDWDTYLKEMQDLGLDKILAVFQARYERAQEMLAK